MKRLLISFMTMGALAWASDSVRAVELLTNPGFEQSSLIPGWTLDQFVTGTNAPIGAAELADFANQPDTVTGQNGLFLHPWAAGSTSMDKVNAIMSQTVPATAGETYNLSGWAKFEGNYSGFVNTLDFTSPLDPDSTGTVPSPTQTTFEIDFLNSSNAVIGSPVVSNLRTVVTQPITWTQANLMGVAPAGTTSVRVKASMIDGVFNTDPAQSAFFDNFTLKKSSAPATDLLTNGNLDAPSTLPGWTVTKAPQISPPTDPVTFVDTGDVVAADFATHTGANGFWLKEFAGFSDYPQVDNTVSQTVAATPGAMYTFSGWAKWEANYSGGVTTISPTSTGPLAGQPSPTQTSMQIEFLNASDQVIGSPALLDLRGIQASDAAWHQHSVSATAPAGTAKVRVSGLALHMTINIDPGQSAFWDDFSLTATGIGPAADFNGDGHVDGADFLIWQQHAGTASGATQAQGDANGDHAVNAADLAVWKGAFGATVVATGAVPEPSTLVVAGLALAAAAFARTTRRMI